MTSNISGDFIIKDIEAVKGQNLTETLQFADSGGINAFLDDKLFKLRIVDGDTVTVKEFDGNLVVSSNCDEGGT